MAQLDFAVVRPTRGVRALLAVLAVLAPLAPAAWVCAQAPAPFPQPLSSAELERCLGALSLDATLREQAVRAFESALAEGQSLRDGDIAAYELELATRPSGTLSLQELEQRGRRLRSLASRQAAIENALFDSLASMASEDDRAFVEIQRRAAERRRSIAMIDPFLRSGLSTDLVELTQRTVAPWGELPDRLREVLVAHDRAVTAALAKAAALSSAQEVSIRQAMDQLPPPPAPAPAAADAEGADAESAAARQRAVEMRRIRRDAAAPILARRAEVVALNRTGLEQVLTDLPDAQRRDLRDAFVRAAYPQIGLKRATPASILESMQARVGRAPAPKAGDTADSAAAREPIPQEAVDAAKPIVDAWRHANDAIERRMMDAIDASQRDRPGGPILIGLEEGGAMPEDPLRPLRAERDALDEGARQQLAALHPGVAELVRERTPPQIAFGPGAAAGAPPPTDATITTFSARAVMVIDGGDGPMEAVSFEMPAQTGSSDSPLRPIDAREFEEMVARLGLAGDSREQAREAWRRYHDAALPAVRELVGEQSGLKIGGGGGAVFVGMEPAPDPTAIDAAMARLTTEDARLLAELATIAGASASIDLERSIRARNLLRQRIGMLERIPIRPWGHFERVDLPAIVAGTRLTPAERAAIGDLVNAHGERLVSLLSQLASAMQAMRTLEDEMTTTTDDGKGNVSRSVNMDPSKFQKAIGGLRSAQQQVADEVRGTLTALRERLPEATARRIRRAAYSAALPGVMEDPRSAEERLERAMEFASLSDERRMTLLELYAAHQSSVDALVDAFIVDAEKRAKALEPGAGPGPQEIRAMRSSDGLQRRLRFDRSEVNDATMRRLRRVLSAEENREIADLPPARGTEIPGMAFSSMF